jgi:hypothetical protein
MARFCEGQVPESRQLDRDLDRILCSIQAFVFLFWQRWFWFAAFAGPVIELSVSFYMSQLYL